MAPRCLPASLLLSLLLACGPPDSTPLVLPPLIQDPAQGAAGTPQGGTTGDAAGAGSPAGSGAAGGPGNGGSGASDPGDAGQGGAGQGGAGQGGSGQGGAGQGDAGQGGAVPALCQGKVCGDPCSPCSPGELECSALQGSCDEAGLCRLGAVVCKIARCQEKPCGAPCEPCPPGDSSCLPGFCNKIGDCSPTPPLCGASGTSGQGGQAGQGGAAGGCQSAEDCPSPPCEPCPDGSQQCPEVSCLDGQCSVAISLCPLGCEITCNLSLCVSCWDGAEACQVGQCVGEQCVLVGEECPPKPSCDPVQAKGEGPCAQVLGFLWDGQNCTGIAGCSCAGAGCAQVAATYGECVAARAHCTLPCTEPTPCP